MTGAGENGLPMARAPRGRGAGENPANRYHRQHVEAFDDGWSTLEAEVACGGALPTEVSPRSAKSIIARNESPDIPFEQSINPYQGCEHGCVYCFARPTHAYWDLSPGLDFETKIVSKPNAPDLLRKELGRRSYRCSPIALGTNTDPYQPVERSLGITRQVLEVLVEARHPFSIVTKSAGVLRDLDLISEAARAGRALVCLSVTTLDGGLASRLEPRAAAPRRRLDTMQALAEAGVPVGVMASPMIPALTDHELEAILEAASDAGASTASWLLVRLPLEVRELFAAWLRRHEPDRAEHVLSRIREMRNGRLNDSRFGHRMRGHGPYAELMRQRFEVACRKFGLGGQAPPLDTGAFRAPAVGGQGRLF